MASFSDLVRAQRQSGKSVVTSLSGAYNQMNLQRYDPRNVLFGKGGIMTSLFPGLKGYQASAVSSRSPSSMMSAGNSPTALSSIARDARISARNSMALPSIARNMAQMVRIWGGTPAKYFEKARERETAYEAKQGGGKKGFPGLGKSAGGGGGFNIMGMLGGVGSLFGSAVSGAGSIIGSILGGVGSLVGGAFSGIFGLLSSALGGMGIMGIVIAGVVGFALYSLWKSLDFSKIGSGIGDTMSSIKEALSGLYKELDEMTGGKLGKFVDETQKMFQSTVNKIASGLETAINLFKDLGSAVLQDMYGFMINLFQENKGKILGMIAIGAMGALGGFSTLTGAAVSLAVAAAMAAYGKMTGEKSIEEAQSENDALRQELKKVMKDGRQVAKYNEAGDVIGYETAGQRASDIESKIKENEAFIKEKQARTSNTQGVLNRLTPGNISQEYNQNLAAREGSPTPAGVSQFMGKGAASFISSMEGFAGKAYLDPPGNTKNQYSIGHGHLITAHEIKQGYINLGNGKKVEVRGPGGKDTTISKEEAQALLSTDIPKYEKIASDAIGADAWQKLSEDQRSALTSLAYNAPGNLPGLVKAGLRDAIMKGDSAAASNIIYEKGWKTSQGKYLAGLDARRRKEASLFAGGTIDSSGTQMASAQRPSAAKIPGKETPKPSASDSAAAFAADQIMALDKMMGGQLLKGSSDLADMLRDITREFMSNPTFVDSSQTVNNNMPPGLSAAVTGSAYNPDVTVMMSERLIIGK
jgi:GH24 family phage-related lysozyme (muramidase)